MRRRRGSAPWSVRAYLQTAQFGNQPHLAANRTRRGRDDLPRRQVRQFPNKTLCALQRSRNSPEERAAQHFVDENA